MTLPFWLIELVFWALIAAIAVLAFALRRRALFCVATLAFLPFGPAAWRYLTADPAITLPDGSETTRVFVILVVSFVPVWIGFAAGLLFQWLNTGFPAPAAPQQGRTTPAADPNWREGLSTRHGEPVTPQPPAEDGSRG